jgi:DNA-binding NarL/FixJ family response regulator
MRRRHTPKPPSPQRARRRTEAPSPLTPRELEVLQLIADGLESRQIARELYIADDTVKTHVSHVLEKLGATSRANAVAIAIRSGLID